MDALGPQHAAAILESLTGQQENLGTLLGTALGGECGVDAIQDVSADGDWKEKLSETQLALGLLTSETGLVLALPKSLTEAAGAEGTADKKWRDVGEKLESDYLAEHFKPSSIQVTTPEDGSYIGNSLTPDAACLAITVQFGGAAHTAYLVWPLAHLILLFTEPPPESDPADAFAATDEPEPEEPAIAEPPQSAAPTSDPTVGPDYSHSLLQIKLPVMVTLAKQKLTVNRILEVAPGTLIQFDKFCEDMLDVEAAEHKIALGEAVKVGDKFGVKIMSIVMPPERFVTVQKEG